MKQVLAIHGSTAVRTLPIGSLHNLTRDLATGLSCAPYVQWCSISRKFTSEIQHK